MRRAAVALVLLLGAACSDGRSQPPDPVVGASDAGAAVVHVTLGGGEVFAGLLPPETVRDGWPYVLFREALPRRAVHYNLSEGPATAEDVLATQLPQVAELAPTIVTVWVEHDDVASATPLAEYEASLTELLDALRSGGHVRVLVGRGGVPAYDAAVDRAARAAGAEAVEVGPPPQDGADHARVADAFAAAIGALS